MLASISLDPITNIRLILGVKSVYLGVTSQHRGYKCLNKFGKVCVYKDVLFHENSFPFSMLFPNTYFSISVSTESLFFH